MGNSVIRHAVELAGIVAIMVAFEIAEWIVRRRAHDRRLQSMTDRTIARAYARDVRRMQGDDA